MKIIYSKRHLYILAFSLIFVVNLIVLWGIFINRSAEPDFEGFLTERELGLPWIKQSENSILSFRIYWRRDSDEASGSFSSVWLNDRKLQELGFKTVSQNNAKDRNCCKHLPKEVFIVLEYNGSVYEKALLLAEKRLAESEDELQKSPENEKLIREYETAKNNFEAEQNTKSRLFAIDSGLDHKKLRAKYPDRSKFIITKGIITPKIQFVKNRRAVVGYINKLSIEKIYVPLPFKRELESILNKKMTRNNEIIRPGYKVKLAYGSRLEPYIVSLENTGSEQ
ncbi:MAG: hypothetical protein CSB55_08100 [Candidatus Cloacimonadota bacterium]|nr:MAG: hypothetical protein CSB55_08100 [Candidatus Cloacimonadota bacterium]